MPGSLFSLIGAALLGVGTLFCMLGMYGVMRMPDFYNRLQAAGMVITLGAGSVLLSLLFLAPPQAGLRGLATATFLSLTAPMATHVLARTAYRHGVPLAKETVRDELAEDEAEENPTAAEGAGAGEPTG